MINLTGARILITNDDGVNAPGLDVLFQVARSFSDDVWIVAPESEQSGKGHSLTLQKPLSIKRLGERRYCVDGTPTDSILLGLNQVLKDHKPDLVLSGVNRGGNLGEDFTYSGTIGAAMEATLLGVPAIALSQYFEDRDHVKWETTLHYAPDVIRTLCQKGWPKNSLINLNFPDVAPKDVKGVKLTSQGRRKIGDDLESVRSPWGEEQFWVGAMRSNDVFKEGCDLEAIEAGYVSVTPFQMDFTDYETMKTLEDAFK